MPNLTFAMLSGVLAVIFLILAYTDDVVFGDARQTMKAAVEALQERPLSHDEKAAAHAYVTDTSIVR